MPELEILRLKILILIQQFDTFGIFQKLLLNHTVFFADGRSPEGLLRLLGFVHLYTASGIHIYAILESCELLVRHLKIHSIPGLRIIIRVLVFSSLIFLWALQDFRFGFLRPLLIFGLRQWSEAYGLKWNLFAPLGITLGLDCLFGDEYSGQLHYYLAVGGGIIAIDLLKNYGRVKNVHVALAIGSWIWIAGYELLFENRITPWTPLWSLVTLPLFCTLIYPVMVTLLVLSFSTDGLFFKNIFVEAGKGFTTLFEVLIEVLDYLYLGFFIVQPVYVWVSLIISVLFTILFFRLRHFKIKLCVSLIVILFFARMFVEWGRDNIFDTNGPQTKTAVQLDVSQGDSLLVKSDSVFIDPHAEMIDVGSMRAVKPEKLILEFSKMGVRKIDSILLSHLDEDHQGLLAILSLLIPIGCIETHALLLKTPKGLKLKQVMHRSQPNSRILESGCTKFFNPIWLSGGKRGKGNALMAGSWTELDSKTVYMAAGDADSGQEDAFIKQIAKHIKSYPRRIWKVSHHGSKFSSSKELLQKLNPSEVWISVGRKNRYHHPHPSVLQRLAELKIPVQRTDVAGSLRSKPNHPAFAKINL